MSSKQPVFDDRGDDQVINYDFKFKSIEVHKNELKMIQAIKKERALFRYALGKVANNPEIIDLANIENNVEREKACNEYLDRHPELFPTYIKPAKREVFFQQEKNDKQKEKTFPDNSFNPK